MPRIEGVIFANHPSGEHRHADLLFTRQRRRFVASDDIKSVIDKPDEPLQLPIALYEGMRPKFGQQLAVEPVGGGGEVAARTITELQREMTEMRASFDQSWDGLQREHAGALADLAAARARAGDLEKDNRKTQDLLGEATRKIAELEAQLAKKKSGKKADDKGDEKLE